MLSASLEDYLEEIYRLSIEQGVVRNGEIAACLNVTLPSVSKALQRLSQDDYIIYQPYQDVHLTKKGEIIGKYLVERNKLLQNFLQIIGSDCDIVEEAEAMEHYLSKPTILAINNIVNFLNQDEPHKIFKEFVQKQPNQLDFD